MWRAAADRDHLCGALMSLWISLVPDVVSAGTVSGERR
jgi:hypothetical protein